MISSETSYPKLRQIYKPCWSGREFQQPLQQLCIPSFWACITRTCREKNPVLVTWDSWESSDKHRAVWNMSELWQLGGTLTHKIKKVTEKWETTRSHNNLFTQKLFFFTKYYLTNVWHPEGVTLEWRVPNGTQGTAGVLGRGWGQLWEHWTGQCSPWCHSELDLPVLLLPSAQLSAVLSAWAGIHLADAAWQA